MENPHAGENALRVFNTAKVFAEKILFPIMFDYKKFQRQANYGHDNLDFAMQMSEEVRDIQRYNGLKAMCETCCDLLESISSTVRLKKNQEEIKQLESLLEYLSKLKKLFYEDRERFFVTIFKDGHTRETIDRAYFEIVKNNVNICYINTEMLMTKNKLLFADDKDDYLSDQEILDQIKREYIEG